MLVSLRESVILSEHGFNIIKFAGFLKDGFFSYQVHTGISGTTFPAPKVHGNPYFWSHLCFKHTAF